MTFLRQGWDFFFLERSTDSQRKKYESRYQSSYSFCRAQVKCAPTPRTCLCCKQLLADARVPKRAWCSLRPLRRGSSSGHHFGSRRAGTRPRPVLSLARRLAPITMLQYFLNKWEVNLFCTGPVSAFRPQMKPTLLDGQFSSLCNNAPVLPTNILPLM